VPLLSAGILAPIGARRRGAERAVALAVAVVTWVVLAIDAWTLLAFAVAVFGRLPIATPTWLLPALVVAFALMLWPPVLAVFIDRPGWRQHRRLTSVAISLAVVVSATAVTVAPGYTEEQPQRRTALFVDDRVRNEAFWRLAGNEPRVDVEGGPAVSWRAVDGSDRWRPRGAFVFGAPVEPPADEPPAQVTSRVTERADGAGVDVEIAIAPHDHERLAADFVLPDGLVPVSSTLAGGVNRRQWRARHLNVPREGIVWKAVLPVDQAGRFDDIQVWLLRPTLPGAALPSLTPPWLSRERTAWTTEAVTIVPVVPGLSS
jgi:hypothetical protein